MAICSHDVDRRLTVGCLGMRDIVSSSWLGYGVTAWVLRTDALVGMTIGTAQLD